MTVFFFCDKISADEASAAGALGVVRAEGVAEKSTSNTYLAASRLPHGARLPRRAHFPSPIDPSHFRSRPQSRDECLSKK
jgi:hypothetical protein